MVGAPMVRHLGCKHSRSGRSADRLEAESPMHRVAQRLRLPWPALVAVSVVVLLSGMVGCGGEPPPAPMVSADAEDPSPDRLDAGATADRAYPPTEPVPRTASGSWIGVVVAQSAVDLAAGIAGPLARVLVRAGDAVAAGDIVAEVDARLLRPDLRRAEAALMGAEAEQRRAATAARQAASRHARRAAAPEVVSREELAAAAIEAESTAADEEAARARVAERRADVERLRREVASAVVRAPFGGLVAQRLLDPGAMVTAGTPIVRLVSSEGGLVRFAVPVDALRRLAVGDRVRVRIDALEVIAEVGRIAPEIDVAANRVFVDATMVTEQADATAVAVARRARAGMAVQVRPVEEG